MLVDIVQKLQLRVIDLLVVPVKVIWSKPSVVVRQSEVRIKQSGLIYRSIIESWASGGSVRGSSWDLF
jgi:hypothetical protein